jgi:hypothetical protein
VARDLTDDERMVITRMLSLEGLRGGSELLAQAPHTRVAGGHVTSFNLEVEAPAVAAVPDGALAVQGDVYDPSAGAIGMMFLFVSGGRLDSMDYSWVTDDPPTAFPPASWVRVVAIPRPPRRD